MVEKVTPDKATAALSQFGGTVLKSSLSKEGEADLQDALHGQSARGQLTRSIVILVNSCHVSSY